LRDGVERGCYLVEKKAGHGLDDSAHGTGAS